MSDTNFDLYQTREAYLGATERGFCKWLINADVVAMPAMFLAMCFSVNDREVIDGLRERFWDEYVADLEEADRVLREDRARERSR